MMLLLPSQSFETSLGCIEQTGYGQKRAPKKILYNDAVIELIDAVL